MTPITDVTPDITVRAAEYQRLLGYPREHVLDDRALELADEARHWYSHHGRPWTFARETGSLLGAGGSIVIEGVPFTSSRLRATLESANADRVVLVAVSAGAELEAEAQRRWADEKPDEYFFLEMYGAAVVEHLITGVGARLCTDAEQRGMSVLPRYSPGYPEWDISEQGRLLGLLSRVDDDPVPGPLSALESGMLRPKKSLLAVFGLTHDAAGVRRRTDLIPCEQCSLPRCQYRRRAYGRTRARARVPA